MDNPYREPGREIEPVKYPRVVYSRGDCRLVQLKQSEFVCERERSSVDALGNKTTWWIVECRLKPLTPGDESQLYQGLYSGRDENVIRWALWIAERLAELS